MRTTRSFALAYACACVLSTATSHAQESEKKAESKNALLEEIVVTAQRREEKLQEIPIAATALTSEKRDLLGINSIDEFTNFVPGFTYEGQLDRANIRGVGRVTNTPGTDPGVGLYVDGIYNSSPASLSRSSIFTERTEVLRGPQGSLFGRNTTGGAITVVSRRANDSFGGEARLTYGAYDKRVVEGTVTTPVTDWFKMRLTAASTEQKDGYFTNLAPGYKDEGGRLHDKDYSAVFDFKLSDHIDFMLRYSRQDQERFGRYNATLSAINYDSNMATFGNTVILGPTTTMTPAQLATVQGVINSVYGSRSSFLPNPLYNGPGVTASTVYRVPNPTTVENRRVFSANVPTRSLLDAADSVVTNLTWQLPGFDIRWLGGFVTYGYQSETDADGSAREYYDYLPTDTVNGAPVRIYAGTRLLFREEKDYWSNELQFVSTGNGKLQWAGALYQYHEDYWQIPIAAGFSAPDQTQLRLVYSRPATATIPTTPAGYAALGTTPAYINPDNMISQQTGKVEVDTYAAMGQVTWKALDRLSFTSGARLNRDTKEGVENRFTVIWDPSVLGANARAFDNSAPFDCFVPNATPNPFRPAYQSTVNTATGAEIPLTNSSTSYTSACRSRTFEKRTWDDWSGNLSAEWKAMDDLLTYAKYSRGYKSGAIRVGTFSLDAETDPEHSNNYEIGIKSRFFDKYQINTSAYLVDYRGLQFPVTEILESAPGQTVSVSTYTNIEKSRTQGVEVEAVANPWSTLTVSANYTYLKTKIITDLYLVDPNDQTASLPDANTDRRIVGAGPNYAQNVKGNEWPGQPNHKVFANLNYTFNTAWGSLTPSVNYSWRGSASAGGLTVSAFSRDRNRTPSYSNYDARITWTDIDKRYRVIAYGSNLTDNETVNGLAAGSTLNGQPVQNFLLNPPRTYGVSVYYFFGSDRK